MITLQPTGIDGPAAFLSTESRDLEYKIHILSVGETCPDEITSEDFRPNSSEVNSRTGSAQGRPSKDWKGRSRIPETKPRTATSNTQSNFKEVKTYSAHPSEPATRADSEEEEEETPVRPDVSKRDLQEMLQERGECSCARHPYHYTITSQRCI